MEENIVYHYCDCQTFRNILESKVLWLCDLTDSNDEEEIISTFKTLWNNVKKNIKERDLPKDVMEFVIENVDRQFEIELRKLEVFGICFCKSEDLFAQWREYGDSTKGVSLGFDLNWFNKNCNIHQKKPVSNTIQSNAIGYDDVIYDSQKLVDDFTDICDQAIRDFGANAWIFKISPTFKHYSGFIKNDSFKTEHEVRIIYYPMTNISFRENDVDISGLKDGVKKHYEIRWINDISQSLKSICIGHNSELDESSIRQLLEKNGIDPKIEIKQSKCHYRLR